MNRFTAYARLVWRDRALLLRALSSLVSCRVQLLFQKFENLQAWAKAGGHGTASVDRLSRTLNVVLRLMPGATCLCRALALQHLLSQHGHSSELRIGARKSGNQFGAHAWLEHEGRVLIGDFQPDQYKALLAPASRNATTPSVRDRPNAA